MTNTEQQIQLDAKTRLLRSGARLAIQRRQPSGDYDMVASFAGGARAVTRWCEDNGVFPTRAAEDEIAKIPEKGFVDRG